MPNLPSAAQSLYPHLAHDGGQVAKQSKRTLADSMWPHLSQTAKAEAARQARWQAEQKARSARTAENLQTILDQLRAEKRGR
jgi:hypothetical protein